MRKYTAEEICEGVLGKIVCGVFSNGKKVKSVSIDSRKVTEDDVFFAISGENFDAHVFIPQCLEKGCRIFVISDESATEYFKDYPDANAILTDDTSKALQRLAKYYLNSMNIKKIGVTGSTGKTSTKDMVVSVCSAKYKTEGNKGNFNNATGMPLTALAMEEDVEVGVFEMGMDKFGEINELAEIAEPDIGVITNIGVSHIENLGSREGIFKAKMEITDFFEPGNTLIVWRDDEFLNRERVSGDYELIVAGEKDAVVTENVQVDGTCHAAGAENKDADFIVSDIMDRGEEGLTYKLEYKGVSYDMSLPVPGRHNAWNATLAVACGVKLGISIPEAAAALANLKLTGKRLAIRKGNGIKVIDDTYNASPDSMKAGIDVLMNTEGKRKVAVLGDMFELGENSLSYHREVGEYAGEAGCDMVIAIGEAANEIAAGAEKSIAGAGNNLGAENTGIKKKGCDSKKIIHFSTKEEFIDAKDDILKDGDVVLVKASRGMKLDEVVEKLI